MDRPDRDNIIIEGTIRLKEAAQKTVELESNRPDRYKVADNEGDEGEREIEVKWWDSVVMSQAVQSDGGIQSSTC